MPQHTPAVSTGPPRILGQTLRLPDRTVDVEFGRVVGADGTTTRLTARERDVLRTLMDAPGEVVLFRDLVRQVWGVTRLANPGVLRTTITRLRKKLEVDARSPRTLLSVYGQGYRLAVSTPRNDTASGGPRYADAFFGREDALAQLDAWLAGPLPLVDVVGPAGVGKTRLVGHWTAAHQLDAAWVDLSEAHAHDDVPSVVLEALGGRGDATADRHAVTVALRAAGVGLLVLDNAEHVAAGAGQWAPVWSEEVPGLRIVVTSRTHTGLAGVITVSLAPLDVVHPDGRPGPATHLFLDRAARAGGRIRNQVADSAILALVEALDGLPLALELAAQRTRTFDAETLLAQLRTRPFELLQAAGEPHPRRRSLERELARSWNLLSPSGVAALRVACHLQGSFVFDTLQGILLDEVDAFDAISELVDHSMIRPSLDGRYQVLESLRPFCRATSSPREVRATVEAIATWITARWDTTVPFPFDGDDGRPWVTWVAEVLPTVRRLLADDAPLPEAQQAALASILGWWSLRGGTYSAGLKATTHHLRAFPAGPQHADLSLIAGLLHERRGELAQAQQALHDAVATPGDSAVASIAWYTLARIAADRGELPTARSYIARGQAGERHGPVIDAVERATQASVAYLSTGDVAAFVHALTRCLPSLERAGTPRLLGAAHNNLGGMYYLQRRAPEAVHHFRSAHEIFLAGNELGFAAIALTGMGHALDLADDLPAALVAYQRSQAEHELHGDSRWAAIARARVAMTAWRMNSAHGPGADLAQVLDDLARCRATLHDIGDLRQAVAVEADRAHVLLASRRRRQARQAVDWCVDRCARLEDTGITATVDGLAGWMSWLEGDASGQAQVVEAIARLDACGAEVEARGLRRILASLSAPQDEPAGEKAPAR